MRQGHDLKLPGLCQSGTVLDAAFFKDKPVERLLGSGMQAEYFIDDALGRALDAIYSYGPDRCTVNWRPKRSSAWGCPAKSAI